MKRHVFAISMLAVSVAVVAMGLAIAEEHGSEPIRLFDGESLDGWAVHHVGEDQDGQVWMVSDGVLRTTGEPFGYIHTEEKYESFKLVIEWRWPEGVEPSNSGVLLRIAQEPISFLTQCIEAQLMHGSVGDIWAFYGATVEGPEERFRKIEDHPALDSFIGVGKIQDAERPPGEWNTYEITLDGENLTLVLNGEPVNEATGLEVLAGPIGLQSEGGPIEFRKIELTPIEP